MTGTRRFEFFFSLAHWARKRSEMSSGVGHVVARLRACIFLARPSARRRRSFRPHRTRTLPPRHPPRHSTDAARVMASSVAPLARAAALPTARVPASARPRAVARARARRACSRDTIRALAHGDAALFAAAAPPRLRARPRPRPRRFPAARREEGLRRGDAVRGDEAAPREQAPKEGERNPSPSRGRWRSAPDEGGLPQVPRRVQGGVRGDGGDRRERREPIYAAFVDTGLERTEALSADIAWFERARMPAPPADGPGAEYAAFLRDLAESSPRSSSATSTTSTSLTARAGA